MSITSRTPYFLCLSDAAGPSDALQDAGLADPTASSTCSLLFSLRLCHFTAMGICTMAVEISFSFSKRVALRFFDIVATSMNYTGASLAVSFCHCLLSARFDGHLFLASFGSVHKYMAVVAKSVFEV
jgi:hypothetical protein